MKMPNLSEITLDVLILWVQSAVIVTVLFFIGIFIILKLVKCSVPKELYILRDLINKLKETQMARKPKQTTTKPGKPGGG